MSVLRLCLIWSPAEMGLGKTVELLACILANKFCGPAAKKADQIRHEPLAKASTCASDGCWQPSVFMLRQPASKGLSPSRRDPLEPPTSCAGGPD